MFKVCRGDIYHIRGDTGILQLHPSIQGQVVPTNQYDAFLTVKESFDSAAYIVQKKAVEGKFYFNSGDTQNAPPNDYIYDVEFHLKNDAGQVEQIATFGPNLYHLLGDVTNNSMGGGTAMGACCQCLNIELEAIAKGDPGKSAYEVWLTQPGNEGKTVAEFLASLKADIDVATKEDIDTILNM